MKTPLFVGQYNKDGTFVKYVPLKWAAIVRPTKKNVLITALRHKGSTCFHNYIWEYPFPVIIYEVITPDGTRRLC